MGNDLLRGSLGLLEIIRIAEYASTTFSGGRREFVTAERHCDFFRMTRAQRRVDVAIAREIMATHEQPIVAGRRPRLPQH